MVTSDGGLSQADNEFSITSAKTSEKDKGARHLLIEQIREEYGRAAYTHKTQEKQADLYFNKNQWQRRFLVGMTAIGSGTFLTSLLGILLDGRWSSLITSFIALAVSVASLSVKNFKYGEASQQHRNVAAKIWGLRESYLSLIVDLTAGTCSLKEGLSRRNGLQKEAMEIYGDAPRTTVKAYLMARDELKNKEGLTFSEDELDYLLPKALRKCERKV